MQKKTTTYPRATTLTMDMGQAVEVRMSISRDGVIEIASTDGQPIAPTDLVLERSFMRDSGKRKVLSSIQLPNVDFNLDPSEALKASGQITVVDANKRQIRDSEVWVAGCVRARLVDDGTLRVWEGNAIEFRDIDCNADLLAMQMMCADIERLRVKGLRGRVTFVIDSDLGELHKFRSGQKPLIDDWFLPSWASLAYASDAAMDSLANQLLRRADAMATEILNGIETGLIPDTPTPIRHTHSDYVRILKRKKALLPSAA